MKIALLFLLYFGCVVQLSNTDVSAGPIAKPCRLVIPTPYGYDVVLLLENEETQSYRLWRYEERVFEALDKRPAQMNIPVYWVTSVAYGYSWYWEVTCKPEQYEVT